MKSTAIIIIAEPILSTRTLTARPGLKYPIVSTQTLDSPITF